MAKSNVKVYSSALTCFSRAPPFPEVKINSFPNFFVTICQQFLQHNKSWPRAKFGSWIFGDLGFIRLSFGS